MLRKLVDNLISFTHSHVCKMLFYNIFFQTTLFKNAQVFVQLLKHIQATIQILLTINILLFTLFVIKHG